MYKNKYKALLQLGVHILSIITLIGVIFFLSGYVAEFVDLKADYDTNPDKFLDGVFIVFNILVRNIIFCIMGIISILLTNIYILSFSPISKDAFSSIKKAFSENKAKSKRKKYEKLKNEIESDETNE
jgi:hypothetical protein